MEHTKDKQGIEILWGIPLANEEKSELFNYTIFLAQQPTHLMGCVMDGSPFDTMCVSSSEISMSKSQYSAAIKQQTQAQFY